MPSEKETCPSCGNSHLGLFHGKDCCYACGWVDVYASTTEDAMDTILEDGDAE